MRLQTRTAGIVHARSGNVAVAVVVEVAGERRAIAALADEVGELAASAGQSAARDLAASAVDGRRRIVNGERFLGRARVIR